MYRFTRPPADSLRVTPVVPIAAAVAAAIAVSIAILTAAGPALAGPEEDLDGNGRRRGSQNGLNNPPSLIVAPPSATFSLAATFSQGELAQACANPGGAPLIASELDCDDLSGGTAHIAAGVGLRNRAQGTIGLTGAPTDARPVAALLYVGVIFDGAVPATLSLLFQGQAVVASRVVTASAPCWMDDSLGPPTDSIAIYRASVIDLIPPAINGDYTVAGVPSAITSGTSPALEFPAWPLAEGASLVVVYLADSVPEDSIVYVHEDQTGAPILGESLEIDHDLETPLPAWGSLLLTTIAADGQTNDGLVPLYPMVTELIDEDGALAPLSIRGTGSAIDSHPDFAGLDGGSVTQLWDTRTTAIDSDHSNAAMLLPAGSSGYTVRYRAVAEETCESGESPGSQPPEATFGTPAALERPRTGSFQAPGNQNPPQSPPTHLYDCVNVAVHVLTACGEGSVIE